MSSIKPLTTAMREWAEVFMARSMREWHRYVKSTGLSMPQFSVLMRLYHRGGCGISDISEQLDATPAAASQMVDRLLKEGWVERAEDPNDRRAKQVTLSAKGRALIENGMEARNRWTASLLAYLPADQHAKITEALRQLAEATRKLGEEEK
jgi:DNA-binding MarR family transcriptional regulator